jgi:hypothetical protein
MNFVFYFTVLSFVFLTQAKKPDIINSDKLTELKIETLTKVEECDRKAEVGDKVQVSEIGRAHV